MYFKAVICENSHSSPVQSDDLTKFSLGKALKTIFICAPAKRRMAVYFSATFVFPSSNTIQIEINLGMGEIFASGRAQM